MIPYERHERILERLGASGLMKIADLQDELPGVSASTLRRDLKELERLGKIEHLSGGAVKLMATAHEVSITSKDASHSQEKETVAQLAADEVADGDVVYVDSGSTGTALLRRLIDRPVTIYTTNGSACLIRSETRAEVNVVGGVFNPVTSSLSGAMTLSVLRDLYFDRSFLGINAIDEERGCMTPSFAEAEKKRAIAANSQAAYMLCDSSKFHTVSNVRVLGFDGITIVSDATDEKIARCARLITPTV